MVFTGDEMSNITGMLKITINDLHNIIKQLTEVIEKLELSDEFTMLTNDLVINLVRDNPGSTANELAKMVGDTTDRTRKLLYSLMAKKKVIQSGRKICDVTNHEALCWWVK